MKVRKMHHKEHFFTKFPKLNHKPMGDLVVVSSEPQSMQHNRKSGHHTSLNIRFLLKKPLTLRIIGH